uniref:Vacuolar protein-sorting-associated protein 37 homolog 1-like n=1 Tax=Tanacetum cinerariifolium TaxID=118510 RepID=A0A6L2P267_TANCI|nr:vacuolar protein-sorting-associated protein 37 homolog 1-like [Tanacetum cinerariifolium]
MSDYLLRLQKEYPNCSFLTTMKSLPVGSGWMSLIDNDWKKDMIEGPKSLMYLEDTPGLLQLSRNTSHQIWELTHFRGCDRRKVWAYRSKSHEFTIWQSLQDGEMRLCLVDDLKMLKITYSCLVQAKGTSSSLKFMITTQRSKTKDQLLHKKDSRSRQEALTINDQGFEGVFTVGCFANHLNDGDASSVVSVGMLDEAASSTEVGESLRGLNKTGMYIDVIWAEMGAESELKGRCLSAELGMKEGGYGAEIAAKKCGIGYSRVLKSNKAIKGHRKLIPNSWYPPSVNSSPSSSRPATLNSSNSTPYAQRLGDRPRVSPAEAAGNGIIGYLKDKRILVLKIVPTLVSSTLPSKNVQLLYPMETLPVMQRSTEKISMPARLMYDGCDDNLFEHFSGVAQIVGLWTINL